VRQAGFLVLNATTMPSILIELGYISHTEEAKYLASSSGQ
jgi:N-acetylmuramoyl-L-alanine amidase